MCACVRGCFSPAICLTLETPRNLHGNLKNGYIHFVFPFTQNCIANNHCFFRLCYLFVKMGNQICSKITMLHMALYAITIT